jgi:signal transduction histidine kinase
MAYNRFYLNILVRIIALSLTLFGFFYILFEGNRFFTSIFLGILILVQLAWMFYYINTVNLNLSRFLLMLSEEETAILPLRTKVEKTFGGLQHSFQKLNSEMAKARLDREYATVLIQEVVENSSAGILAWDQKGKVEMINQEGLRLLDLAELGNISELDRYHPGLHAWILKAGKTGRGVWNLKQQGRLLVFRVSGFRLGDKTITLVSFQNIRSELEESEMESWEKLIRVLKHEVSNSVTPITTLGAGILKCMASGKKKESGEVLLAEDHAGDIQRSAELIEQRGNGLIDFIGQYKTFMRLPEPDVDRIGLSELLDDICRMCRDLFPGSDYIVNCSTEPPGIHCMGDRKMVEQVLLNLVRNAIEAIPEAQTGRIEVSARPDGPGHVSIEVRDNGRGIPAEILDQVFIPFFTTKKKGSGIGLSFCRRIITMNGGKIRIQSTSVAGTVIRFTLPV